MKISAGLRAGFWDPYAYSKNRGSAFTCKGYYTGPDIGDHIPGTLLEQALMEGTVRFRVGVLFRPDLDKRHRLETILILENFIPEMFDYEDWSEDMVLEA